MLNKDRREAVERLRAAAEAAINEARDTASRGLVKSSSQHLAVAAQYTALAQEYRQPNI